MVDEHQHTVQLVRDHLGLEPFFYCLHQDQLVFGSNLPDVIRALGFTPSVNQNELEKILQSACGGKEKYADETLYQTIFRVEPGCLISIQNKKITKAPYWQLDKLQEEPIHYQHTQDYVEHFTALFHEGIQTQIEGVDDVAVEFSGGLDSSSIVCGLHHMQHDLNLFMHVAPDVSQEVDDSRYAFDVMQHLGLTNLHCIDAENFDVFQVIETCAQLFAGTPHYLFPIGANNIHQAVASRGHRVLFSGFGGDECASSHAPLVICLRELMQKKAWGQAWRMARGSRPMRCLLRFIYHRYVSSHKHTVYTMRQYEAELLQGVYSYHVRLRLEDTAIMGQALGFSMRYPLLYPPLLEFCHQLPLYLKRNQGMNRLMIRHYLAQFLPEHLYQKHQKVGGIMPATLHKMKQAYQVGEYDEAFCDLPYQDLACQLRRTRKKHSAFTELLHHIFLLCLNKYSPYAPALAS
jgi:asparagine synthase (glutamine-hydrolysing)